MATHFKGPAKPRAPKVAPISLKDDLDAVAPISLKDELDADEPVEAPTDTPFAAAAETALVEAEPASEPVAPPEAVEIFEPAAAIVEPLAATEPEPLPLQPEPVVAAAITASVVPTAPMALDASALPLKTLDLFNENAAAVLDFALALGSAKSVGDAIELQSRFASERYSSLVRQAGEFAELTRRLAFQSAPFKLRVSTFVA
jgi:cell division septation protein DedD